MAPAVVNFALGPNGHYWFQYEGETGEVITRKLSYILYSSSPVRGWGRLGVIQQGTYAFESQRRRKIFGDI